MMRLVTLCRLYVISALSVSAVSGMELSIPNPSLSLDKKVAAGAAGVPREWKLLSGPKESCRKWVGQSPLGVELSHVILAPGSTLSCEFSVGALTEKETKVKRDWTGVLSLDLLGTIGKGSSRCELSLHDAASGKKLHALSNRAKAEVVEGKLQTVRVWSELNAQQMAELVDQKLTLKLSVEGSVPLLVSGVSFSRLHSQPTSRLFGKPNGGKGPDLLGVGSLGFDAITEHQQNILTVLKVREKSPAEKAGLKDGDKIIGVAGRVLPVNDVDPGWNWYRRSHEAVIGRAVLAAWSAKPPEGKGVVSLHLLRNGKPTRIRCQLSQTMDFQPLLSSQNKDKMHQQMIEYLVNSQNQDGYWKGVIQTTFSALALLATEDPAHAERVKKAVDWMLHKYPEPENFGNLGYWHASYAGILYAEYYLATGDSRVLPRIEGILRWVRSGLYTSKWGMLCLGHGTGGLPYGNKALVAPATHALVLDSLAEKCGIESGLWDALLPYMEYSWSDPAKGGHGALGYNASYKDKREFWSRSGLFSMAAHLRGERQDMEDAMISFMHGHHPWFRNSHAYGEPGGSLGLLALNLCRPDAFTEVMNHYSWWFALAWDPNFGLRFTMPHMGAPYMGTEDLINASYALVFAAPKKSLWITGGQKRDWLDVSELETPLSPVIVRRNKQGQVDLECRLPGPKIRYTTDGSQPSKNSPIYEKSIDFPAGGTIKARAMSKGIKMGEITTVNFGPAKAGWKVLAASGHKDPAEAVRRAGYAIDHSPGHSWLTDIGQDAQGYPHYIVIDLGAAMPLNAVKVTFTRDKGAAGKCIVKGALTMKERPVTIGESTWQGYQAERRVDLSKSTQVRYIRLEFSEPFKEGSVSLALREIDVE
ncbi:chitobiase/beta-hexosaminidase C-terminal domain-containing protein [Verrucomicrobiaceae bacterium 5K15]|uniref:Chitobiase/beta-hexosaminidase C-terminal domain-containing protein n=1 Tax=Oceaniferula flava TaxID=2800421 RepID=A0AAE2SD20_9BACT|nr:DUF6288 domain-containing protein [Oceaniferula flavus]MBK1854762.1 chitobiase/beta-hexosaminidase C-terminal domain-containing protein [Oceaniferula flavus]MBM1136068.1 chitobiase/beta-hexosaminidase C-terminal domain-containing protein [Oceaniferula flavus]